MTKKLKIVPLVFDSHFAPCLTKDILITVASYVSQGSYAFSDQSQGPSVTLYVLQVLESLLWNYANEGMPVFR